MNRFLYKTGDFIASLYDMILVRLISFIVVVYYSSLFGIYLFEKTQYVFDHVHPIFGMIIIVLWMIAGLLALWGLVSGFTWAIKDNE